MYIIRYILTSEKEYRIFKGVTNNITAMLFYVSAIPWRGEGGSRK